MKRKSSVFDVAFTALMIGLLIFFARDGASSEADAERRAALSGRIAELQRDIDAIESRRRDLERKVQGLVGPEIDPDLLDERLRAVFGGLGPNEVFVTE